ncbi:hypothetical protein [Mesorhizobium japonicum]|uniref:hypothetical protein n=1 Tax=Mesorhizobium japonicum TaxID=2066070 RepID=UPI003B5BAE33
MPGENSPKSGGAKDLRQDLIWRLEAFGFRALFDFLRLLGVERAAARGGWLRSTCLL